MNNKIILFLSFIGLIGLLVACEKDETKVIISSNPTYPTIVTLPDLTFEKGSSPDTIVFRCTPANIGFSASMKYKLQACQSGLAFKTTSTIQIYFGDQDTLIRVSEKAVNKLFKPKKYVPGVATPTEFRVIAIATVDAGTGALGSSTNPLQFISEVTTHDVTVYTPVK